MIIIFGLFHKKQEQNKPEETNTNNEEEKIHDVLDEAHQKLTLIENHIAKVENNDLFLELILFVSYYKYMISFYSSNQEEIISVKELLFLKYIDMVKGIIIDYDENITPLVQKNQIINTVSDINEKLYKTVHSVKEKQEMDLSVNLKTIRDLIKSDF